MAFNNKLGEATVEITAKFDKFKRDLRTTESNVKSSTNKMTSSFASLGRSIAGVVAAGAILQFGKQAVEAAANAEEGISKFRAVFKDQANDVEKWVDAQTKALGRSRFAWIEYLGNLQDTFVPMGLARDKAAELSKQLVVLAEDVASFSNKLTPDVLRDFQSALVGNTETVRKYGVVITQARLNAELLAQGIEGGVKKATEQEKVLARVSLLMKDTADSQGDAARTADSYTNRMKALNAELEVATVLMGNDLKEAMGKLIKPMSFLIKLFSDGTKGVSLFVESLGALKDKVVEYTTSVANASDNPFAQAMRESKKVTTELVDEFTHFIAKSTDSKDAVARLNEFIKTHTDLTQEQKNAIVEITAEVIKMNKRMKDAGDTFGDMETKIQSATDKLKEFQAQIAKSATVNGDVSNQINEALGKGTSIDATQFAENGVTAEYIRMEERSQSFREKVIEDMKESEKATKKFKTELSSVKSAFSSLISAFESGDPGQILQAFFSIIEQFSAQANNSLSQTTNEVRNLGDEMKNSTEQGKQGFDGLLKSIDGVGSGASGLGGIFSNLFGSIGGGGGGGGGIGGLLGGLFGGGGGGGGLGSLFGGFFADGGSPPMGKVSVVGENGPELFVPNTSGTIIPNHQMGNSGGTINLHQTFVGVDDQITQRIREETPSIIQAAKTDTINSINRGQVKIINSKL